MTQITHSTSTNKDFGDSLKKDTVEKVEDTSVTVSQLKKEILDKIDLVHIKGEIQGIQELRDDMMSKEVKGSDIHPVVPPIKPVDLKSITIELEDNQLVLKLGGVVRNKHVTPVANTKFTQLLMMIKDQFSNWNANNGKNN